MSNEQIVEQIQKGINVMENQEKLWMKNQNFVRKIIKQYCGFTNDLEDLEQQGFIGLITAASKYDFGRGVQFISYAGYWIKQSIFRYNENCGSMVRVPTYLKTNIRKYERYQSEFKNRNGRYPTSDEICRELKISPRSLKHLEKAVYNIRAIRLDAPASSSDTDMLFLDYLQSDENIEEAVTCSVYCRELRGQLDQALELLDQSTREMIYSVYYQGNSRVKTADIFQCTKQNVNERIGRGFYRIIHSSHRSKLEEFMGEKYCYNERAYSGYADLKEENNEFLI